MTTKTVGYSPLKVGFATLLDLALENAYPFAMSDVDPLKTVTRLFPFVIRSRILMVGRDTLWRSRNKLQFVLITNDLSENSRAEILSDFAPYAIVQCFESPDLKTHFNLNGAKVIGFQKSDLASSIYAELKSFRINKPEKKETPPKPSPDKPA